MNEYQILALIIAGAMLVVVAGIIIAILLIKRKKKLDVYEYPLLLTALGGVNNIVNLAQKGSRISVNVNDKTIIDKEKIKDEGIDTIVVSNKKVTMVVDNKKAVEIFNYLKEISNQKELN